MNPPAEDELAAGISDVLGELGRDADGLRIAPIPGGASRDTLLIETDDGRYVLRRDPPGAEALVSQEAESKLIGLAAERGAPVPAVLRYEPEGGRFETAGMLMDHIEGESVAPRLLRKPEFETARARLPAQLGTALARIHTVDVGAAAATLGDAPSDPVTAQIEVWEEAIDQIGEPLPACEAGLRWLRANAPDPAAPSLVHGDFRLGNFIVNEEGLAAVIDWELAHIGDPAEDIGWPCIRSWRFGADEHRFAGVGDLETFVAAYEEAGGREIDANRILYWEVFGNLKWAVICARQAHDHRSGLRRSHELASLGRRICEPEWDMLGLFAT